jgi:catechol 2,3-dioxygenase-like lactoylglutathione lyase family enzyme
MSEESMHNQIDQLLDLYERRGITRRALIAGLTAVVLGSRATAQTNSGKAQEPFVRAHTLNHVSIDTADVARSKAFYQRLAGLAIRDEGKDFCELRLDGGFLGLYAREPSENPGIDHFCLGVENYDAKRIHADLQRAIPEGHATLEYGDQVYVRDPDGVRIQFADVSYKR